MRFSFIKDHFDSCQFIIIMDKCIDPERNVLSIEQ